MKNVENKELFRKYVELLRISKRSDHYFNHYPWQALIVIENILRDAAEKKKDVRIFSGSLFEIQPEQNSNLLRKILQGGNKVEIILAKSPSEKELIGIREFLKQYSSNVEAKYMNAYQASLSHVWIAGKAYRFELPHPIIKEAITEISPEVPAQFAFNNEDEAEKVNAYWQRNIISKDLTRLN